MRILRTLAISPNAPDVNTVWLYKGTMKYFNNGTWQTVGSDTISWEDIENKPVFAAVATSGSYNDLTNKPSPYTLPAATTSTIGGVKKTSAITNLATGADVATITTKVNELLTALKTAGIVTA